MVLTKETATRLGMTLLILAMGFTLLGNTCAQATIPGYRSPLISTLPTPTTFRTHLGGATDATETYVSNEVEELARALKYDPALMYKFVHDYIDFEQTWGDVKGSHMTWMDRSGNAFDQATLMIDLLEEAQTYNTALTITDVNYVVGEIELTSTQLYKWMGISGDDTEEEEALARAGFYGNVSSGDVDLIHVWVKATVDSVEYEFDPSFKTHSQSVGMFSLNSYLASAMGYNRTTFQSNATSDMGSDINAIWDVNNVNVKSDLNSFVSDLKDEVEDEASFGDITLKDVIGGKTITAVDEDTTLPSSMPYTISARDDTFTKSDVPLIYRTTLQIEYNGIDKTFNSSDIYGRKLTLSFNGSNQPVLTLDGTVKDTGNACTIGNDYDLDFTVDHPDESNSLGQSSTLSVTAGGFYSIFNGWGETGTHILASHRQALTTLIDDDSAMDSEDVLGYSYNLVGLSWMAQTSKMRAIAAQIKSDSLPHWVFNQHVVGVVGAVGDSNVPYMAIADNTFTLSNQDSDEDKLESLFFTIADYSSLYQEKTIQQLQGDTGISTVSLLTMGNDRTSNNKTYHGYHSSYPVQYSAADKNMISAYDSAGYKINYPEYGALTSGSWSGACLTARKTSATELNSVHLVTGARSASDTGSTALDVNDVVELSDSGVYKQQDGVESTGSTDLSIGTGSLPFGLTFSRSYSSANRLKDGPLGKGWTHNFDISIKVLSVPIGDG